MAQESLTPTSLQTSSKAPRSPLPPPIPVQYHATIEKGFGSRPLSEPTTKTVKKD